MLSPKHKLEAVKAIDSKDNRSWNTCFSRFSYDLSGYTSNSSIFFLLLLSEKEHTHKKTIKQLLNQTPDQVIVCKYICFYLCIR